MNILLLLLAGLVTSIGSAWAAGDDFNWDFHGIKLGASESEVTSAFPDFKCQTDGSIRRCESYFNFREHKGVLASYGATTVDLVFVDNKLVNINIIWFPAAFETAREAFIKVYGSPLNEEATEIVTTGGKKYENRTVIWHNGTSTIKYSKYYENVPVSRVLYMLK